MIRLIIDLLEREERKEKREERREKREERREKREEGVPEEREKGGYRKKISFYYRH